ncbi:MAG: YfhO family protein [Elusimicrobia bacterium]|nr:YfhO family protein [Elusimicrobiota bacterium]
MNKTKEYFLVSFLLFILVFIFFWKAATLQEIFITPDIYSNDTMGINYPYKNFLSECLKQNKSFLWTSDIQCGYPIHAEGQGGFCYPLNLLLFRILPSPIAFNYSVILTFYLVGIFTYFYVRLLGLGKTASLFSAISFMFSGFFILHVRHLNMIQAACWVPLLFYLVEKYFKTDKIIYIILTGVVFSFQILAGHPQIPYYSFIAILIYFLFGIFRKKRITPILLSIGIIMVIGIGLSAIQLVPTYELVRESYRATDSKIIGDLSNNYPYKIKHIIQFILPFYYGNIVDGTCPYPYEGVLFWENIFYVGILPIIFMIIALMFKFKDNLQLKLFLVLIIVSITIALHNAFHLTNIFQNILPGFKYFRIHQRILFINALVVCIIAGFGVEIVLEKIPKKYHRYLIILILFVVIDLFKFGIKQNPTYDIRKWFSVPKSAEFLKSDKDVFRTESFTTEVQQRLFKRFKGYSSGMHPYFWMRNFIIPNFNMVYHISSVSVATVLSMKRVNIFNEKYFNSLIFGNFEGYKKIVLPFSAARFLGLQNVKYIISGYSVDTNYLKEKPEIAGDFYFYENKQFTPKSYIIPKAEIISDDTKILEILQSDKFDPLKTVILEENINHGSISTKGSVAKIEKYENTDVLINANLTDDGFLVLSDTYYPGWKCYVDGKESKILRANYLFRAIALNKGEHIVEFVFKPISFKIGMYITIFTALLIFGMLFIKVI